MDYIRLKEATTASLNRATYNPKKLALLHGGAMLLLSLVLTAINFFLSRSINNQVGLSNLDNRAILGTVQAFLSVINLVATPFWTIGFFAVALRTARWSNALPGDLLDGFRNWGAVLRLYLLQFIIYILVAVLASQVSTILYSFTPFIEELSATLQQASTDGQSELDILTLLPTLIPMYIIFGLLFAVLAIPLFYRFRMSFFAVADGETSARKALGLSSRMLRNKKLQLFKLDLRFWWYYGAQLFLAALAYLGTIVDLAEISLPFSRDILVYGAYGVYWILQLLLYWLFSIRVQTTYAHYYDELKAQIPTEPVHTNPWQQKWNPEN